MDLTWCFPQPEPAHVGDQVVMVLPFRLIDMASLQNYCKLATPCPLDGARAALACAPEGSEARRRLLRDTYRACQKWPARLGSPEGQTLLATDRGLRFWLATLLGPCSGNDDLTEDVLDELVRTATVSQYETLSRIAYGCAPLDELSRLITPDSFVKRDDKPTNWGEVIAQLIADTGWTFAECAEIRLTQLAALRTKGKHGAGKCNPPPGMTVFEFSRRQKRFFGPDRSEDSSDGN